MNFFKIFIVPNNIKKIKKYIIMLFVLLLALFAIITSFYYYNIKYQHFKESIPNNLIVVYDCDETTFNNLQKEEEVVKIYPKYYALLKIPNNSDRYYELQYLDTDIGSNKKISELKTNEIIIQESTKELLNVELGDSIKFNYSGKKLSLKVVEVIANISSFDNVIFTNYMTLEDNDFKKEENNYLIVVHNFDNISDIMNKYHDITMFYYNSSISKNINDFKLITKILNILEKVVIAFIFLLIILIFKIIIAEEKKDIAIYRTIGFSLYKMTIIYFLKLLFIVSLIFISSFILFLVLLIFLNLLGTITFTFNQYLTLFISIMKYFIYIIIVNLITVLITFAVVSRRKILKSFN